MRNLFTKWNDNPTKRARLNAAIAVEKQGLNGHDFKAALMELQAAYYGVPVDDRFIARFDARNVRKSGMRK